MGAPPQSKALPWLAVLTAAALLVAALLWRARGEETPSPPPPPAREQTHAPPLPSEPRDVPPREPSPPPSASALAPGPADAGPEPEAEAPREHPVNLAKLREQLPDNLYWELGVPTKDPEVLRRRAEAERHWNDLLGKIQSGTATEEEIHQYYEHRRQLSEDYISFASLVLQQYGEQLPDQERGMYELSIRMHRTRLEELPGQIDAALERKRLQDERREAWLKNGGG